jgi:hypothetical protein
VKSLSKFNPSIPAILGIFSIFALTACGDGSSPSSSDKPSEAAKPKKKVEATVTQPAPEAKDTQTPETSTPPKSDTVSSNQGESATQPQTVTEPKEVLVPFTLTNGQVRVQLENVETKKLTTYSLNFNQPKDAEHPDYFRTSQALQVTRDQLSTSNIKLFFASKEKGFMENVTSFDAYLDSFEKETKRPFFIQLGQGKTLQTPFDIWTLKDQKIVKEPRSFAEVNIERSVGETYLLTNFAFPGYNPNEYKNKDFLINIRLSRSQNPYGINWTPEIEILIPLEIK